MPIFITAAIEWLTTHAVRLAIIGALSMTLGVGIYMRGQQSSAIKCASSNAEVLVKELEKDKKSHEEVSKIPSSELDSVLNKCCLRPHD